jgi:hypothetical protein
LWGRRKVDLISREKLEKKFGLYVILNVYLFIKSFHCL